jgi:type I restriction enzyme S subunit
MSDVPEGYSMSEVGIIPSEWEVKQIKDVCKLINGRGFKPHEWRKEGFPIIRIQNLNGSEEYNYYQGEFSIKIVVEHGQLLFAWSGSRGTSFGPHIWNGQKGLLNYHTWKVNINETNIEKTYFYHALKRLTKKIEEKAHGASALVHTQKWEMEGFEIPLPHAKAEQQAIASALSDVDALITALEQLITKKRNIKQGAMQQLLTGEKRLPGFGGAWEVKILKEVVDFLDEKRRPIKDSDRAQMRGYFPYYGASGIIDYVNDYIFDDNLILLGEDGENIISRNSRLVFQISGKVWVNNHAHVLKPKPDTDLVFLTEYLESLNYELYNTGTAQPKLNKKVCSSIPVTLPPLPEQQAIAKILSDMDTEIEALEQKRDKYKAIKQGMMQELLTGKTRLV